MKSKLIILLLFVCFFGYGQSIPDQAAFCLSDVLTITGGSCLSDAFTNSDAAKFDAIYGSKTMSPQYLGGFRNYGACVAPTANAATGVSHGGWTVNWDASINASYYLLDVAYDNGFTQFLYENYPVGSPILNSYSLVNPGTHCVYYYRLRTVYAGCTSGYSNIITVTISGQFGLYGIPYRAELHAMRDELYAYGVGSFKYLNNEVYWSYDYCSGVTNFYALLFITDAEYCREYTNDYYVRPTFYFKSTEIYNLRDTSPDGGIIFAITDNGDGTYLYSQCTTSTYEVHGTSSYCFQYCIDLATNCN